MVLRRLFPLLILALGIAGGIKAEPDAATAAPAALRLPLSSATRTDAASPEVRAVAIRQLISAGEISSALPALAQEKDARVLAEALSAIGDQQAQETAADFLLAQVRSANPELAALAYTALGSGAPGTPDLFREGFQHPDARVRAAALQAASISPFAEQLQPAFEKLCQTNDAPTRAAAVAARLALVAQENPSRLQSAALALLQSSPALAEPVLSALLQLGSQPDAALTAALLALPPEQLEKLTAVYRNFPDQLDSNFLRAVALLPQTPAASTEAVKLLARKSSPKTTATLSALSAILQSDNPQLLAALLDNFAADLEFSSFTQTAATGNEDGDNKDRFHTFDMATSAIAGGTVTASASGLRHPQTGRQSGAVPDRAVAIQFLGQFDQLARNTRLTGFQRARATLLLQQTIRGASYADLLHGLFTPANPAALVQAAAHSAFLCWETPRFAEIALLAAHHADSLRGVIADPAWLAPYLAGDESPEISQVFAAAGRQFLRQSTAEKQLFGLMLLSHHGAPSDATALLPFCRDAEPQVRRAAWQALSSAAPEVFFLHAEKIFADPDPRIRIILPLALLESGYRWEHRLDATTHLPQWVMPRFTVPSLPFSLHETFARLREDTDASVRQTALLAAIQREILPPAPAQLDALLPPTGDPLRAAQIRTNFPSLIIGTVHQNAAKKQSDPATLVVFLRPDSANFSEAENVIHMFRQTYPRQPLELVYQGSESARRTLRAVAAVVPFSLADRRAPVLAVSSGSWWSGEKLDLARLQELAQDGIDASDPALLDRTLAATSAKAAHLSAAPISRPQLLLGLGGAVALCLLCAVAGLWWRRKKSRKPARR